MSSLADSMCRRQASSRTITARNGVNFRLCDFWSARVVIDPTTTIRHFTAWIFNRLLSFFDFELFLRCKALFITWARKHTRCVGAKRCRRRLLVATTPIFVFLNFGVRGLLSIQPAHFYTSTHEYSIGPWVFSILNFSCDLKPYLSHELASRLDASASSFVADDHC